MIASVGIDKKVRSKPAADFRTSLKASLPFLVSILSLCKPLHSIDASLYIDVREIYHKGEFCE